MVTEQAEREKRQLLGEEVDAVATLFTGTPVVVSLVLIDGVRHLEWKATGARPDEQPHTVLTTVKDRGSVGAIDMIATFAGMGRSWNASSL